MATATKKLNHKISQVHLRTVKILNHEGHEGSRRKSNIANCWRIFRNSRMTVVRRAGRGFTAECFRKKGETALWSASRKIYWDTAGDSRGRTIAASFTTAHRRSRMERRGANARS